MIRPATADELCAWYGGSPPFTMRAWVAVIDGRIAGIGGMYFSGGAWFAFSQAKPWARRFPRQVVRAFMEMAQVYRDAGQVLMAVADPAQPSSGRLLSRMGFEPTGAHVHGGELYRWRN